MKEYEHPKTITTEAHEKVYRRALRLLHAGRSREFVVRYLRREYSKIATVNA